MPLCESRRRFFLWVCVAWLDVRGLGLLHGICRVLERLVPGLTKERASAGARLIRHVYVLLTVVTGWVFFRADTLPHAVGFLRSMAGWGVGAQSPLAPGWYLDPQTLLAIVLGLAGSTPTVARLARTVDGRPLTIGRPALVALLLVVCSMFIAARSYNPFIYFRF